MNHYSQSLSEQELYTAEELKIEDEEEEEIDHMTFKDFYKIVDDLKKFHPTFRPQDFKAFMKSDEFKEQYDDIVSAFLDDFGDLTMDNAYYRDVVIALSTIGIEIPKPRTKNNSVNDEDENNNVVEDKTDELLFKERVLARQTSEVEA